MLVCGWSGAAALTADWGLLPAARLSWVVAFCSLKQFQGAGGSLSGACGSPHSGLNPFPAEAGGLDHGSTREAHFSLNMESLILMSHISSAIYIRLITQVPSHSSQQKAIEQRPGDSIVTSQHHASGMGALFLIQHHMIIFALKIKRKSPRPRKIKN